MSAYVTYDIRAYDVYGEQVGTLPVRAVQAPELDEALALAREEYGIYVGAVEVQRSIPAKIGKHTPVTRRVSARIKVLA